MKANSYLGYSTSYASSTKNRPSFQKKAGPIDFIGGVARDTTSEALKVGMQSAVELIPYILLLPAIAGGLGGYVHSKVTSPSSIDVASVQKSIELSDLKKLETDLLRRRGQAMAEEELKQKGDQNARALRI